MNKSELETLIKHHNDLYWNGKELEISDVEYDKLVEELKKIDPENELITSFGKENLDNEKTIKHSKKMLSLNKIYSKDDLVAWVFKVSRNSNESFLIQPKYDGMSGLLENGTLSSRGNGEYGLDYTDKLKMISLDTDKSIDVKKDTLLGEIIISNSDFNTIYKNIKSKSGIPFKNQRNGIAGILGTDDANYYYNQGAKITFVDYDKNSWETTCEKFGNDWENIVENILNNINYPLDGIVIKLKDQVYSESLGCTSHHPKGAVAFKFTNQKANSKLIDVEWGMGKRNISAVGIIDPVEISGITIKRVKLQLTKPQNTSVETYVMDGSLQIGDNIVIERAGDIIPHIISSTPGENRKRVNLEKCPFCGGDLIVNETSVQCANENCTENRIQDVYSSVVTLGFKNVGEAYIRTIINDNSLNVKHIADLMELKPDDLKLKEYGTRKKEIFFEEMDKVKKNTTKELVFASLNLYNIGKTVSKLLVNNFDWNDLITGNITETQLLSINGIGATVVDTLTQYLGKDNWVTDNLKRLTSICEFKDIQEIKNGLTVCFTGKMEYPRSKMEQIASEKGFVPVDHVDKNLNILVTADPNSNSSKIQKAKKYGIKVISETDFINM